MKRLWFTQQRPFRYMPLKAGIGLATEQELEEYTIFSGTEVHEELLKFYQLRCKSLSDFGYRPGLLCPKLYTTRSHRLNGNYQVVEGSRYKNDDVRPIDPPIELTAVCRGELNLRERTLDGSPLVFPDRFAEVDLGIRNATFDDLIAVILKLNNSNTLDKKYYANRLLPLDMEGDEPEQSVIKTGKAGIIMQENKQELKLKSTVVEQAELTQWGA